ncbi:hypothetical protein OJ253_2109 [Cryptosporidium canis]|uniref:Uncharacterized protein n=1 Tax=Cryptosporidium canis TaxID=195482 RepID=A0A9D5DGW6_9CRYT|nr:hypothetical protein OJ253_2109 [Cryptosporidium canis]
MEDIPIVLFAVKKKETALYLDSYSQTDNIYKNTCATPRDYSNYYHSYIKKYKNYDYEDQELHKSRNNYYRQNSYFLNRRTSSNKHEHFELQGVQNKGDPLIYNKCGYDTSQFYGKYGIQKFPVTLYQSSQAETSSIVTTINNAHFNTNPQLKTRKIHVKYPYNQDCHIKEYYSEVLCKCCRNSSLRNANLYHENPPNYNFISDNIPEAIAMTVMIGINAVVEVIAGIAIKCCARIPDKDYLHPGTGCVLMDQLNDKIDHLISEQSEENNEVKQLENEEDDPNPSCEAWINSKLDEVMENYNTKDNTAGSKFNSLYGSLIKNCYHKANDSEFDPMKYSENLPYSIPFTNSEVRPLKRGFLSDLGR